MVSKNSFTLQLKKKTFKSLQNAMLRLIFRIPPSFPVLVKVPVRPFVKISYELHIVENLCTLLYYGFFIRKLLLCWCALYTPKRKGYFI